MSIKNICSEVGCWITDLVDLLTGLVALGVLIEVLFGTGVFGVSVVSNLVSLVSTFGTNGFAGLLALLILVGLYRK